MFHHLNPIGIVLAFFVYFILGALWFTVFFSKLYKKCLGRSENEILPKSPIFIIGPAVCTLIVVIVSAILIEILQVSLISSALGFSLFIGGGYLITNTVNIAINPNIPKPISYSILTGSYHLLGFSLANIIIVLMRYGNNVSI